MVRAWEQDIADRAGAVWVAILLDAVDFLTTLNPKPRTTVGV